ncbi:MAG: bifunctional glutamate N-acetyltransferase/amino-acid acetyltransferase ArgJ [Desulfonauticus sp.]|nr:bifunctional glutamate N-acetyltransferase/amino-acid acetyltransferase ArgJ [Desulfonauticus sp.]
MQELKGFVFATAQGGFKYSHRDDIGLIYVPEGAVWAGVFTQNKFPAAPVLIAKKRLQENSKIKAVLVNAGQANACTGERGIKDCQYTLQLLAKVFSISEKEIVPASTGVIGEFFDLTKWEKVIDKLKLNLGQADCTDFAKAILTTDRYPKLIYKEITLQQQTVPLVGIAKGAGMIAPNMATMLAFILCDLQIDPLWWQNTLSEVVDKTFNRISVDGDTSTNDTVLALASGKRNLQLSEQDLLLLKQGVYELCFELAYLIVQDGEGATKVVRLQVIGATNTKEAEQVARTISSSLLVKTAFFGEDPNWGRIVAALGRSGVSFDPDNIKIFLGKQEVFARGIPVLKDIDTFLQGYMQKKDLELTIDLGQGRACYELLFSDLSLDYVQLNGSYRS